MVFLLAAASAQAAIIKYVTEKGQVWYVDRVEAVPEKYRDQIRGYQKAQPSPLAALTTQNNLPAAALFPSGVKRIEIFIKPNCVSCQLLESFLKSRHVNYIAYDIEKSPLEKQIYDSLNQTTVPVVRIGSQVIPGFSPTDILSALEK